MLLFSFQVEQEPAGFAVVRLAASGSSTVQSGAVAVVTQFGDAGPASLFQKRDTITSSATEKSAGDLGRPGPEIDVLPGTGKAQSEFVGLKSSPVPFEGKGLKVVLVTGPVAHALRRRCSCSSVIARGSREKSIANRIRSTASEKNVENNNPRTSAIAIKIGRGIDPLRLLKSNP